MNEDTEDTKPDISPVTSPGDSHVSLNTQKEATSGSPLQEANTSIAEGSAGSESEISATPPASTDPPWNLSSLDTALDHDEKNPFSCMSEEDMSQIDAVLSSEEGKKILQQTSSPEFKIDVDSLHDTGNGFSSISSPTMGSNPVADTSLGLAVFNQTSVTDLNDSTTNFELDDSLIQAGLKGDLTIDLEPSFSDHAYCITPARLSKQIASRQGSSEGEKEDNNEQSEDIEHAADTPKINVEGNEAQTPDIAGDDKGDEAEKKDGPASKPKRRSTRIQDQEQREMAEKIRQENIQKEQEALQAMRGEPLPVGRGGKPKSYNMRNRTATQKEIIRRVAARKKKVEDGEDTEKDGESQNESSQVETETAEEMETSQDADDVVVDELQDGKLEIVEETVSEEVVEPVVAVTGKGRGRGRGRGKQIGAKGPKKGGGRGKKVIPAATEGDGQEGESMVVGVGRGKKKMGKLGAKVGGKKGAGKVMNEEGQFENAEEDGEVKAKPKNKGKGKKPGKKLKEELPKGKGKKKMGKGGIQREEIMGVDWSSGDEDSDVSAYEGETLAVGEKDEENEADNEGDDGETPKNVRRGKKTKRAGIGGSQDISGESDDSDNETLALVAVKKGKTKGKKTKQGSVSASEAQNTTKGKKTKKKGKSKTSEFVKSSSEMSEEDKPLQVKDSQKTKDGVVVGNAESDSEGELPLGYLKTSTPKQVGLRQVQIRVAKVDIPTTKPKVKTAFRDPILMTGDIFKVLGDETTKEEKTDTALTTDGAKNKDADNVTEKSVSKRRVRGMKSQKEENIEQDDEESSEQSSWIEDDDSWGSDDDPDRLWCICRKPYNNRFMIQCEKCQDWFHGSCVGVTRKQGKEIAKNNMPWSCPRCTEKQEKLLKKEPEIKRETTDSEIPMEVDNTDEKSVPQTKKGGLNIKKEEDLYDQELDSDPDIKSKEMETDDVTEDVKPKVETGPTKLKKIKEQTESLSEKVHKDETCSMKVSPAPVLKEVKEKRKRIKETEVPLDAETRKIQESVTEKSSDSSTRIKIKKKDRSSGEPCIMSGCNNSARVSSVYCSNSCIAKHAQESLKLLDRQKRKTYGNHGNRSKSESKPEGMADPNERIMVIERKTGKILTGPNAPTAVMLKAWLERHPTFEVVQPGQNMAQATGALQSQRKEKERKVERKDVSKERKDPRTRKDAPRPTCTSKLAQLESVEYAGSQSEVPSQEPEQVGSESLDHPTHHAVDSIDHGPDPFRLKVRKSFKDALDMRANESDDIMLTGGEIKKMAVNMEEELFHYVNNVVDLQYKSRYRSLIFHIRDPKNKGLFRKILNGNIKIRHLVRMNDQQMMSFAKYRPKDLPAPSGESTSLVPGLHSHSWRKPVERNAPPSYESSSQPKPGGPMPHADYLGSLILDTTPQHRNHLFDLNCKVCTGKMSQAEAEAAYKKRSTLLPTPNMPKEILRVATGRSELETKWDDKVTPEKKHEVVPEKTPKKEDPTSNTDIVPMETEDEPVKPMASVRDPRSRDPRKGRHGDNKTPTKDSAKEVHVETKAKTVAESPKQDPTTVVSSTTVSSPDSALQSGLEVKPKYPSVQASLWKGVVFMQDLAKFFAKAYAVSGHTENLSAELPNTVHIMGRLAPEQVYDYLVRIRQSSSREVLIVRLQAATEEEKNHYVQLYSYLNGRHRCGVVGQLGKILKDMYIMPLAAHSKIPSALLPFRGPGLPIDRPHLLLGIIIRLRMKRIPLDPRKANSSAPPSEQPSRAKPGSEAEPPIRDPRKQIKATTVPPAPSKTDPPVTSKPDTLPIPPVTTSAVSTPAVVPQPIPKPAEVPPIVAPPASVPQMVPPPPSMPRLNERKESADVDSEEEEADEIVLGYGKAGAERVSKPIKAKKKEEENLPYEPGDDMDDYLQSSGKVHPDKEPGPESKPPTSANSTPTQAATVKPTQNSPFSGINLSALLDQISKTQNPAEMTAAMLATFAATASSSSLAEQRQLLFQLTEKVEEQKKMLEKKKEETIKLANIAISGNEQVGQVSSAANSQAISSTGSENSKGKDVPPVVSMLPASSTSTMSVVNAVLVQPSESVVKPSSVVPQSIDMIPGDKDLEQGIGIGKTDSKETPSKETICEKLTEINPIPSEENSNHSGQSGSSDVDSILNMARKRLELKIADQNTSKPSVISQLGNTSTAPPGMTSTSLPGIVSSTLTTLANTSQPGMASSTPSALPFTNLPGSASNISLLPRALQNLLAGKSFDVTKKTVVGTTAESRGAGKQNPSLPAPHVEYLSGWKRPVDTAKEQADSTGKLDVACELQKLRAGMGTDSDSDYDDKDIFHKEEFGLGKKDIKKEEIKQKDTSFAKDRSKEKPPRSSIMDEEDELEAAMNDPGGWTDAMREERTKKALFYEDVGQDWVEEDYSPTRVSPTVSPSVPSHSFPTTQQANMMKPLTFLPRQISSSDPNASCSRSSSSLTHPVSSVVSSRMSTLTKSQDSKAQEQKTGISFSIGRIGQGSSTFSDSRKQTVKSSWGQTFPATLPEEKERHEWDQLYSESEQIKRSVPHETQTKNWDSIFQSGRSRLEQDKRKVQNPENQEHIDSQAFAGLDSIPGLGSLFKTGKSSEKGDVMSGNSLVGGPSSVSEAHSHLHSEKEDASIEQSLYGSEGEINIEEIKIPPGPHIGIDPDSATEKTKFKAKLDWDGKQTVMQRKFRPISETARAAFRNTPSPEPKLKSFPQLSVDKQEEVSETKKEKVASGLSEQTGSETGSPSKQINDENRSSSPVWSEKDGSLEVDVSGKRPTPQRSSSQHRSESPSWPQSPEEKHLDHKSRRREDRDRRKKRRRSKSRSKSRSRERDRRRHRSRDRRRGRSRSRSMERRRRKRSSDRKRRRSADREHRHHSPHRRRSPKRRRSPDHGDRRRDSESVERRYDRDRSSRGSDSRKWKRFGEADDKEEGELSHDEHSVIDLDKSEEGSSVLENKSLEPGELESDPELPDANTTTTPTVTPLKGAKESMSPRDLLQMVGVDPSTVPLSFFGATGKTGEGQPKSLLGDPPKPRRPPLLETPRPFAKPPNMEDDHPTWRSDTQDCSPEPNQALFERGRMESGSGGGRGLLPHPNIPAIGKRVPDNQSIEFEALRNLDYDVPRKDEKHPSNSRFGPPTGSQVNASMHVVKEPPSQSEASQPSQRIPSETRTITLGDMAPPIKPPLLNEPAAPETSLPGLGTAAQVIPGLDLHRDNYLHKYASDDRSERSNLTLVDLKVRNVSTDGHAPPDKRPRTEGLQLFKNPENPRFPGLDSKDTGPGQIQVQEGLRHGIKSLDQDLVSGIRSIPAHINPRSDRSGQFSSPSEGSFRKPPSEFDSDGRPQNEDNTQCISPVRGRRSWSKERDYGPPEKRPRQEETGPGQSPGPRPGTHDIDGRMFDRGPPQSSQYSGPSARGPPASGPPGQSSERILDRQPVERRSSDRGLPENQRREPHLGLKHHGSPYEITSDREKSHGPVQRMDRMDVERVPSSMGGPTLSEFREGQRRLQDDVGTRGFGDTDHRSPTRRAPFSRDEREREHAPVRRSRFDRDDQTYMDHRGDRGPPRRSPDRGPPRRSPERRPPRRSPDRGPARCSPDRGPPRRSPERGPPRRSPDRGPPRRSPDRGPARRSPDRGPSRRSPDRMPLRRSPERPPPRRSPDRGLSRQIADRGPLRRSPDRGPPGRGAPERGFPDRMPPPDHRPPDGRPSSLSEVRYTDRIHPVEREQKDQWSSQWRPPGPDQGPQSRGRVERGPPKTLLGIGPGPPDRGPQDKGDEGLLDRGPGRGIDDGWPERPPGGGPPDSGRRPMEQGPPETRMPDRDGEFMERGPGPGGPPGRGPPGRGPPPIRRGGIDQRPPRREVHDEDWAPPRHVDRDSGQFSRGPPNESGLLETPGPDSRGPNIGPPEHFGPRGPGFGPPPRFQENFPRGPRPQGPGPFFRGAFRGGPRPPPRPRMMGPRPPHR